MKTETSAWTKRFILDPIPHLSSVTAALWVPRGSRHEGRGLHGASHLLEHVVTSSGSTKGANFSQRIAELGGRSEAVTTPEFTVYVGTVPHTSWEDVWQRLESQYVSPDFSDSSVEAQKLMVIDEIAGAESRPDRQIHAAALSQMLGRTGLGYPSVGLSEDIRVRTPRELRNVHRTQRGATPMVIVSGNFDPTQASNLLSASPLLLEEDQKTSSHVRLHRRSHRVQVGFERVDVGTSRSHVLVSWLLPARTPADDIALGVINRLAGGAAGGTLQAEFRRSEGAYSSYTYRSVFSDCAVWSAYLSCSAGSTVEATERIIKAVNSAWATAIGDVQARERASIALAGSLAIGLESTRMRVNWIGRQLLDRKNAPVNLQPGSDNTITTVEQLTNLRERLIGPHVTIFQGEK